MIDLKTLHKKDNSEMEMTVGQIGESVYGIEKLAQHVTNVLLTDPGTNLHYPAVGAGIKKITSIGSSNSLSMGSKKAQITAGVMETEKYIIRTQTGTDLPDDEKLLSLQIIKLEYTVEQREWFIDILVKSVYGSTYIATIN